MKGTLNPRVKICCIKTLEEAKLAIAYGASVVGLVGAMPSGPGVISDEQISLISKTIPPGVSSFLLTSETHADNIIAHHKKVNTSTIQLVDKLKEGSYQKIRTKIPSVKIIQVIHVLNEASVEEAIQISKFADAILLDSGNPNLAIKELGGTGKTHNWNLSKMIREEIDIPVFLAGGLNQNNVREAIDFVQPFGVDLCSGVRTNGDLDPIKLKNFMTAVNRR